MKANRRTQSARPRGVRHANCNISISRGKSEGRPEGAKRPTAGDEPREFTSRGEGGRVPPFFEKLPRIHFACREGARAPLFLT